ncbi:Coenzyme F420 hydrogenase/dehydrogenase, beta subunit C-terminal domain [Bacteroides sp.]|uniref:Coenzyme F420 hydrogenase/dehydrogenase, beta subunit C-terminal domain n=1 Tax=Bacteroides sp. TaxID=29523 RepID=UPI002624A7EA|nr:Coenzyme F420 hydrogenase/dehydrogenase, beta subunit C-terminal domain [Bacteroides sp.]MDD3040477.1 Coenzyme F420 hydrogenase/dehydrogenase, beta subunit C-terminal domain [Bacteroides sp.]
MKNKLPKLANYKDCTGCMLCADICNHKAIRFYIDTNGFWKPVINEHNCVGCKLCETKCTEVRTNRIEIVCRQPLRGHAISEAVRLRSTSGGLFYSIAEHAILSKNAVVYGAVCEGTNVFHKSVETIEELKELQGSKYAQSNASGIYTDVRSRLRQGRYVVFSGTPCQVNALRVYLKNDYDNLLCIDLICHGVPSNILMYRHLAINKGDGIIQFRTKERGWGRDSYLTISRKGQVVTIDDPSKNLFYHAFQSEQCFRLNCYKCQFNDIHRTGDITLGDFWAIRFTVEYDRLGESTILPNSIKGLKFLQSCNNIEYRDATWDDTLRCNPRLYTNRQEYLKTALSSKINRLYRLLPSRLADYIFEAWHSKHRHLFYLWSKHLERIQKNLDANDDALSDILKKIENNAM